MNKKMIGAVLSTLAFGTMSIAQAQDKPADAAAKPAKAKKGKHKKGADGAAKSCSGDKKGGEKSCSGDKKGGEKSCSGAKGCAGAK